MTVESYLARCEALKGKPVQLAGYLGECAGYDCHLYAEKARYDAAFAAGAKDRGKLAEPDASIGIGGEEAFDRKAAPLQHSYVVITGTVAKDTCTGAGGTDRSAGIEPTDIQPWSPTKTK
ncbi:hypothetical protein [Sphingomonas sp. KR3-1]|uniref:hypothetical protein n=1 Tax=Sphingomonas sp. KR3-1 TaxID=3156611 RepID=UPI0032B3C472